MKPSGLLSIFFCVIAAALTTASADSKTTRTWPGPSNATVLIIRHAEKPASGDGLTPAGEARANTYAKYFEPFNDGKESFNVDALYATSDTTRSARPKLTLLPLSTATGLPIQTKYGNYDASFLAESLRNEPPGKHVLISWHYTQIPELITTLGGDAKTLLPNGKWPVDVFNWVIELQYDESGKLLKSQRIQEQF
jgi:hypothetical protein